MKINENINAKDSCNSEESAKCLTEASCLGAMGQEVKYSQGTKDDVDEKPPSENGRIKYRQVIKELSDRFMERDVTDRNPIVACSQEGQSSSNRKKSFVMRSSRHKTCINLPIDKRFMSEKRGLKLSDDMRGSEEASAVSPSPGISIDKGKESSINPGTEQVSKQVEKEFTEQPQLLAVLEALSQFATQSLAVGQTCASFKEKSTKASFTDTKYKAKEREAENSQSESKYAFHEIMQETSSMSLPVVDGISYPTDVEVCTAKLSELDLEKESTEYDKAENLHLNGEQINVDIENSDNMRPEPAIRLTLNGTKTISENQEENIQAETISQECAVTVIINQDTIDLKSHRAENMQSEISSCQLNDEAKKSSQKSEDLKEKEHLEKQGHALETKMPCTKSLVALFSNMHNKAQSLISCEKERSSLSFQFPKAEKTNTTKSSSNVAEQHMSASRVFKDMLPAETTLLEDACSFMTPLSVPSGQKSEDAKKYSSEVRVFMPRGLSSPTQIDVSPPDQQEVETEPADTNAQSVEAILLVLESMQRTLKKISSKTILLNKEKGQEDILLGEEQGNNDLAKSSLHGSTPKSLCVQERVGGRMCKTRLAYNIANHIVGQAIRKIVELYPEYFARLSSCRSGDLEAQSKDFSSSTSMAMDALREVLNDLNGESDGSVLEAEVPKLLTSTAVGTSDLSVDSCITECSSSVAFRVVNDFVTAVVSETQLNNKTVQTESDFNLLPTRSDAEGMLHYYCPEKEAWRLSYDLVESAVKEAFSSVSDRRDSALRSIRRSVSDPDLKKVFKRKRKVSESGLYNETDGVHSSVESLVAEGVVIDELVRTLSDNVYHLMLNVYRHMDVPVTKEDAGTGEFKVEDASYGCYDTDSAFVVEEKSLLDNMDTEKIAAFNCNHSMLKGKQPESEGLVSSSAAASHAGALLREVLEKNKNSGAATQMHSRGVETTPCFPEPDEEDSRSPGVHQAYSQAGEKSRLSTAENNFWTNHAYSQAGENSRLSTAENNFWTSQLSQPMVDLGGFQTCTAVQCQMSESSSLDVESSLEGLLTSPDQYHIPQARVSVPRLNDCESSDSGFPASASRLLHLNMEREQMNRELRGILQYCLQRDPSSLFRPLDTPATEMTMGHPDLVLYADAFRPGPSSNRGRSPRLRREDPLTEGPKAEQGTSKSVTSLRNELPDLKSACVNHPGHRGVLRASRPTKEFGSISEPRLNTTRGNARQDYLCSTEEPCQLSQSPDHGWVHSGRGELAPSNSPHLELNVSEENHSKIPFQRPYFGKVFTAENNEDGLASFFFPTSAKQPEKYYQMPAESCMQVQPPTFDRNAIQMFDSQNSFSTSCCGLSHVEHKDASTSVGDSTEQLGSRTSVEQKNFVQMANPVPAEKTVRIEMPAQNNSPGAVPFPSVRAQGQTWCNFCGCYNINRKEVCDLAPDIFPTSHQADANDQQTQQFLRQVFNLHRVKEAIDEQLQELNAQYMEMRKLHSAQQENAFTPRYPDSHLASPLHQSSPLHHTQVMNHTTEAPTVPSLPQHEMDRERRGLRDSIACTTSRETEHFIGDIGGGHLPKQHIYTSGSPWRQDLQYSFGPEAAKVVEDKPTEACWANLAMMKLTIEEHLKQIQSSVRTMPSVACTVQNHLDDSPRCKHHLQPCISAMERSSHRSIHDLSPQLDVCSYTLRQFQEANSLKHANVRATFCPNISPELLLSGGHSNFRHLARVPDIPFDSRSQKPFINEGFRLSDGLSELSQYVTSSPVCGQSAPVGVCSQCNPVDCLAQSTTISAVPQSHSNCNTTSNLSCRWEPWESVHDLRTSGDTFSCVGLGDNPEKVVHNEKDVYLCNSNAASEVSLGNNGCHSNALATSQENDCNPGTKLDSKTSSTYPDVMDPQDSVAKQLYFSGQPVGVSSSESEAISNHLNSQCDAKQAQTFRTRSLSPGSNQHQPLKGLSLIPLLMTDRQAGVFHAFDTSAHTILSESFRRDSLKGCAKTELGNSPYLFRSQPLGAVGIVTEVDAVSSCVDTERKNAANSSSFTAENLGASAVTGHTNLEQERQTDRMVVLPNSLNNGADDAVHAGHFSTAALQGIEEDENVSRSFYVSLQPDCNLNSTYSKPSLTNYPSTCAVNNVIVSAEFARMDAPDGVTHEVSCDLSENYRTQVPAGSDWHFKSGCANTRSEDTPMEKALADDNAERHPGVYTESSFPDVVTSQAGHSGGSDSEKVTKAHQVYKISNSNTSGFGLRQDHDCRGNTRNRRQQVTPGTNGRNPDAKFWQIYKSDGEDVQKVEAGEQNYTDFCSFALSPDLGRCRSSVDPTERKSVGEDLPYPGYGHSVRNHGRFLPNPDATGTPNFSLHKSTSKLNSFVAEERLPRELGIKAPLSKNFSGSEAGDRFLKSYRQVGRKASVSCTEFCQKSRLGCLGGSILRCSQNPRSTEAIPRIGEHSFLDVPRVLQSAPRMWRQHKWEDHHNDNAIWHKEHNPRDDMSIQARLRSVEHVLRRLEDLAHRGGDVRQRHVNTALPVTTRREVTAPQLACGSQQLLQLVQHQISGSKEVLEMGKNMASSLKCRRYKPDSGTAGSLGFSSHSNASSSICSVNPVPDLSDSSVMSFPTASTQTSSSGSGSYSDTSLSREKIERQSFKIQFL